jgi:hypothetical protein
MAITSTRIYQNYQYQTDIPGLDGTFITGLVRALTNAVGLTFSGTPNIAATEGTQAYQPLIRGPGHKKRSGLTCRYVTLVNSLGAVGTQYRLYRVVPIFTQVLYLQILGAIGTTVDISYEDTSGWAVAGIHAETYGLFGTAFTTS